jgi:hypothetical protein
MLPHALFAVWIGLVAPDGGDSGESARTREVAVDRLDVLAEPDDTAFASARLGRGDQVEVIRPLANGWLAIAPPRGSFHWVDGADVEPLRDGRLYVKSPKTLLRFGRDDLARPGPPRRMLLEGMVLLPADRPPLIDGEGRRKRTWRAVAAGADEVRFARATGLVDPKALARSRPATDPAVRKASQRGDAPTTPPARAAGRGRPAAAEDEMAKTAGEFEAIVRASRQRDVVLNQVRDSLRDLRVADDLAYDAEGLLQATSRRVDGEKVFALLDREGRVVTYLKIPAGLDTTNLVARQVGVRGKSRFDEGLKFRLLDVRDLEPLTPD